MNAVQQLIEVLEKDKAANEAEFKTAVSDRNKGFHSGISSYATSIILKCKNMIEDEAHSESKEATETFTYDQMCYAINMGYHHGIKGLSVDAKSKRKIIEQITKI